MEKRKVEITSLKLKMGKTEATLTVEEARKLKKVLEDIFGKETVTVYPSYPIIIEREWPYWTYPYTQPIWNGTNGGTLQFNNDTQQLCCSIK